MPDRSLQGILREMGLAGRRLDHMEAVEASAGNISVFVRGQSDFSPWTAFTEEVELPHVSPALAGGTVFVSATGARLRDVADAPGDTVGAFTVHEGGRTATLHGDPEGGFLRPTSEFNSHLAVHDAQVGARALDYHAVVHAQPPNIVLLSHIPSYQDERAFNRAVMRWEPESVVVTPSGVRVLPFMVPGSSTLMQGNVDALADHELVVWGKHGVLVRSDVSVLKAVDKIEYVEAGAHYEVRNLSIGGLGVGLSDEEIDDVAAAFGVTRGF